MTRSISAQLFWLLILALPVATLARTFVFEEIFRELREKCAERSRACGSILARKFFYIFTCEYCFSHYVTIFFVWLMDFKLLVDDWRGYLVAFFALVFVANLYINIYSRLRMDITQVKVETAIAEHEKDQLAQATDTGRVRPKTTD